MDMYCKSDQKARKRKRKKRREGKLTNELQNIWNEIRVVVCKREGKNKFAATRRMQDDADLCHCVRFAFP